MAFPLHTAPTCRHLEANPQVGDVQEQGDKLKLVTEAAEAALLDCRTLLEGVRWVAQAADAWLTHFRNVAALAAQGKGRSSILAAIRIGTVANGLYLPLLPHPPFLCRCRV